MKDICSRHAPEKFTLFIIIDLSLTLPFPGKEDEPQCFLLFREGNSRSYNPTSFWPSRRLGIIPLGHTKIVSVANKIIPLKWGKV